MTFFQFSAPTGFANEKFDYPTLGFFAVNGAILDGTASNPQITAAPDAHWTVVASGPESGITRYRQPQTPPDDQSSWDGSLLVYDATTRAFVRQAPSDAIASTTGLGQALNAAYAGKDNKQSAENVSQVIFKATPVTAGAAPFQVMENSFANTGAGAGTYNHAFHLGWNAAVHDDPAKAVAGAAAIYQGFEDHYFDPNADLAYGVEWYTGYVTPDHTTIAPADLRPLYWRLYDSTTNTADKSVILRFDIGSGTGGSLTVWGSVKSGTELLHIDHSQALFYVPMQVLGNGQYGPQAGDAQVLIKGNAASAKARVSFQPSTGTGADTNASFFIEADQYGEMYVYDNKHTRVMCNWVGGASSDAAVMQLSAVLKLGNTAVTSAAAGTATALPATPQGYFQVQDSAGVLRKVPYYV